MEVDNEILAFRGLIVRDGMTAPSISTPLPTTPYHPTTTYIII
jgi:hypothetical protein